MTAGAYAANDVIGARLQFVGVGEGVLEAVTVADNAAQNVSYVLVIFKSVPTDITDNNPFDIADADVRNIIYVADLPTTTRRAFTDNSISLVQEMAVPVASNESDGDLWAFLYTTGTPTYAATSDITVTLQVSTNA